MGLSSSTTKNTTVNTPSPQQVAAGNTLNSAFQAQMPRINALSDQVGGLIPGMIDRYRNGDAGINAARGYITSTLGQNGANPYLQQMIDQSGGDMARQVNAGLGTRGNLGGSVQAKILAHELSKNAMGMRYDDYNRQQQLKAQAAGMAPSIAAADTIQIAPILSATQLAGGMPMDAVSRYASGMGGLFGNSGTSTSTQTQPGGLLGSLLGTGLSMLALGSDVRLKEDIRHVGETHGGLPVYTYRYKGSDLVHMGVMAQDVAEMQPEALGPLIDGEFMSVYYGEVR